jgi:hypothetical protein
MPLGWPVLLALTLAVAGCASAERDEAGHTAQRFEQAARTDAAAACGLLAPRTRTVVAEQAEGDCAKGLQELLAGSPASTASTASDTAATGSELRADVAGQSAYVQVGGDVVFLARFADGWRVTAAGCEPPPDGDPALPHECAVEGG